VTPASAKTVHRPYFAPIWMMGGVFRRPRLACAWMKHIGSPLTWPKRLSVLVAKGAGWPQPHWQSPFLGALI
jgi:hypothetical protein